MDMRTYVRTGGAGNEMGEAEGRAGGGPMMLAYEIDGFGSFLRMDDANVPSLLALPYIGYMARCVLILILICRWVGFDSRI